MESYTAPNNPIRLHDEAHGVTLVIGEDEVQRFQADPEILFADCQSSRVSAYDEYYQRFSSVSRRLRFVSCNS